MSLDTRYPKNTKWDINFSRSEEMDISEYILEFEHLNDKMSEFELKLTDSGNIENKQESVFYTKPGGSKQKVKLNPINK